MTSYSIPPIIAPLIANPPLYISLDTTLYAFWAFDIKNKSRKVFKAASVFHYHNPYVQYHQELYKHKKNILLH